MRTAQQRLVYVVEEKNNPSTTYFVAPALANNGCRAVHYDFSATPNAEELAGAIVIFIRYIPQNWAKLIGQNRHRLEKLIFFMDDDVLDVKATVGMPWRYRYKLLKYSVVNSLWLKRNRAELWVSTPYLHEKYASWRPKLVLPNPVEIAPAPIRVFYHGSPATHKAEIAWLKPVIEKVLTKDKKLAFEIIGGKKIHLLYKDLPRTTVHHPMNWHSYQSFITAPQRQVGLTPQLDLPFNRARSYVKFFDIHRCGAVGIYSPMSACAEIVEHNVDGLIVALDQDAWAATILKLANDAVLRQTLYDNAKTKIANLQIAAQNTYVGLFDK